MKKLFVLFGLVLGVCACGGGSSSPTSPTASATTPATRVIALDGSLAFGDVIVGQSKEISITVRNTGTATLTLGDINASASIASLLNANSGSKTVAPGGSMTLTIRFTPTTTGTVSGTITISGDQTSGTNTIAMSGNGVGVPVTVVGVVTDASARTALGGVRVSAIKNDATAQSFAAATTDGNGFYSMVVPSATAISLSFSKDGYTFQSSTVTFTADTRRDAQMTVASPSLEYRVSGTGSALSAGLTYANCSNGTSQASDAQLPWSFTCTSIPTGQFLYISAQNNRNSGCVKTQIYKRGTLYKESESCGAFVIATSSGTY